MRQFYMLNALLCFLGWHKWDDNRTPFPGLCVSYCAVCRRRIHHGALIHRGRYYGRGWVETWE